jgi:hypothetical protein
VASIVPKVVFPAETPFTCHVTAVLVVPWTIAWKANCAPTLTVAWVGESETVMAGGGGGAELPPPHPGSARQQKHKSTGNAFSRKALPCGLLTGLTHPEVRVVIAESGKDMGTLRVQKANPEEVGDTGSS